MLSCYMHAQLGQDVYIHSLQLSADLTFVFAALSTVAFSINQIRFKPCQRRACQISVSSIS